MLKDLRWTFYFFPQLVIKRETCHKAGGMAGNQDRRILVSWNNGPALRDELSQEDTDAHPWTTVHDGVIYLSDT